MTIELGRFPQWHLHESLLARRVIHPLRRLLVALWLRPKDIRHEGLWIAVVKREPARMDLNHDPVSWQENVVRSRQSEPIEQRLVWRNRFRTLQRLAIASAENISRNHQLVSAHFLISCDLIRIDVDQLHDPIRICSARRSHKIRNRLAAYLHWLGEHVGRKRQNIGTP